MIARMPSPGWIGWSFMAFCIRVDKCGWQFVRLLPAHADGKTALWVSVHQQIHDLIDGVLIIREKPKQQFDLQRLMKIILKLFPNVS